MSVSRSSPKIRELVSRGKQLYPNSRSMRHRWVKQTAELLESGRHGLMTGGWRNGVRTPLGQ
jgi:hypothetical protein